MTSVETSDQLLDAVKAKYGFVPNVIREMSQSPAVARVYFEGQDIMRGASLSQREQQAVQLTISRFNDCAYCLAAHRTVGRMAGISDGDLQAIQEARSPADARLAALVETTRRVLESRGHLAPEVFSNLDARGIDRRALYEIIALIGLKTISNYVNHVAHTEIDSAFGGACSEPPSERPFGL